MLEKRLRGTGEMDPLVGAHLAGFSFKTLLKYFSKQQKNYLKAQLQTILTCIFFLKYVSVYFKLLSNCGGWRTYYLINTKMKMNNKN